MAGKSIGQRRIEDRYHGDPKSSSGARARRSADLALTSDKKFMREAVSDTGKELAKSGQSIVDAAADKEMKRIAKSNSMVKKPTTARKMGR